MSRILKLNQPLTMINLHRARASLRCLNCEKAAHNRLGAHSDPEKMVQTTRYGSGASGQFGTLCAEWVVSIPSTHREQSGIIKTSSSASSTSVNSHRRRCISVGFIQQRNTEYCIRWPVPSSILAARRSRAGRGRRSRPTTTSNRSWNRACSASSHSGEEPSDLTRSVRTASGACSAKSHPGEEPSDLTRSVRTTSGASSAESHPGEEPWLAGPLLLEQPGLELDRPRIRQRVADDRVFPGLVEP